MNMKKSIKYKVEVTPHGFRAETISPVGFVASAPTAEGLKQMFVTHAMQLLEHTEEFRVRDEVLNVAVGGWALDFRSWDDVIKAGGEGEFLVRELKLDAEKVLDAHGDPEKITEMVNEIAKDQVPEVKSDPDTFETANDFTHGDTSAFPGHRVHVIEHNPSGRKLILGTVQDDEGQIHDQRWLTETLTEHARLIEDTRTQH